MTIENEKLYTEFMEKINNPIKNTKEVLSKEYLEENKQIMKEVEDIRNDLPTVMKMTIMCAECRQEAIYIKEEDTEKLGFYAFNCKCGNEFMSPKNNPTIKIIEE